MTCGDQVCVRGIHRVCPGASPRACEKKRRFGYFYYMEESGFSASRFLSGLTLEATYLEVYQAGVNSLAPLVGYGDGVSVSLPRV